ncbi:MAG TPA: hypothetical protein VF101_14450 [Gaiellaceae bacterium]
MSTRVPVAPRAGLDYRPGAAVARARAAAVADWFGREAFLVVLFGIYVVSLTWHLPSHIASDTWMTFAYGSEIVHHGLPSHDTLTVWAHGRTWVDQQWLGQLTFYGAYVVGGVRGALALQTVFLGAAMALALVAARRHGGSTRSVTWLALGSLLVVAWGSWTLRVQSFVFPLFVVLLWLLAADSRRPSRRVFWALPIVALWGNLHGTAFLASALVALRGASMLLERDRPLRARVPTAAVLMASPALLLASPYGFSLLGYYHKLLLNPSFAKYVTEWAPTKLSLATVPFYALALLAAWLAGRCRSRLTPFEQAALFVTLVLALLAIRSVVWFMLSALILLPVALDGVLSSHWGSPRYRHLNRLIALPAPLICAWVVAGSLTHPAAWYTRSFPPAASNTVARFAAAHPGARIFANERYADWLVLDHPELRGRIAFDGRFELLTADELKKIVEFRLRIVGSQTVTRGYRLLVLDPTSEKKVADTLLANPSRHVLYRGDVIVIRQDAAARSAS